MLEYLSRQDDSNRKHYVRAFFILSLAVLSASSAHANSSMAGCLAALDWPICGDWCVETANTEPSGLFETKVTCNISAAEPSGASWQRSCEATVLNVSALVTAVVNNCSNACDTYYQACPNPPTPPPCPEAPPDHGDDGPFNDFLQSEGDVLKLGLTDGAILLKQLSSLRMGQAVEINGVLLWHADPKRTNGQTGIFAVTMGETGKVALDTIPPRLATAFDADIWNHADSLNEYTLIGDDLKLRLRKMQVEWVWPDELRPELAVTVEVEVLPFLLDEIELSPK